jgi:hypothetical protein
MDRLFPMMFLNPKSGLSPAPGTMPPSALGTRLLRLLNV